MKKVLLVIAMLAVLMITGCNDNQKFVENNLQNDKDKGVNNTINDDSNVNETFENKEKNVVINNYITSFSKYINNHIESQYDGELLQYCIRNLDNRDMPEMILKLRGDYDFYIILTYNNNTDDVESIRTGYKTYNLNDLIFSETTDALDHSYDVVYQLKDGKFEQIFDGEYHHSWHQSGENMIQEDKLEYILEGEPCTYERYHEALQGVIDLTSMKPIDIEMYNVSNFKEVYKVLENGGINFVKSDNLSTSYKTDSTVRVRAKYDYSKEDNQINVYSDIKNNVDSESWDLIRTYDVEGISDEIDSFIVYNDESVTQSIADNFSVVALTKNNEIYIANPIEQGFNKYEFDEKFDAIGYVKEEVSKSQDVWAFTTTGNLIKIFEEPSPSNFD